MAWGDLGKGDPTMFEFYQRQACLSRRAVETEPTKAQNLPPQVRNLMSAKSESTKVRVLVG